jgi:hypothetical protein
LKEVILADYSVGQILTWIIAVPLVLLFLYFFAAWCERDKEREMRRHEQTSEIYFNGIQKTPAPLRRINRKSSDPMLVFGYWVLLPLLFSSVTIIAIMLLGSLLN